MVCENIFRPPPRPNICRWCSSRKIDHVTIFQEILNLKGHPNCITGSKVTAIFLKEWILPIGGASSGRVCVCSLRSRLVSFNINHENFGPSSYVVCSSVTSLDSQRGWTRNLWVKTNIFKN